MGLRVWGENLKVGTAWRESRSGKDGLSDGDSLAARLAALHLRFTAEDLLDALEHLQRNGLGAELSARDRDFWNDHSGISLSSQHVARGSANNAAAQVLMDASSLTAAEVAENLYVSESTVRRYRTGRKLYSYPVNGRLVFPTWQFSRAGSRVLPGLARILAALPGDLHPQAVAGFFLAPQPDLVMNGASVSVAVWLKEGGSVEPVLALATALNAAY